MAEIVKKDLEYPELHQKEDEYDMIDELYGLPPEFDTPELYGLPPEFDSPKMEKAAGYGVGAGGLLAFLLRRNRNKKKE